MYNADLSIYKLHYDCNENVVRNDAYCLASELAHEQRISTITHLPIFSVHLAYLLDITCSNMNTSELWQSIISNMN